MAMTEYDVILGAVFWKRVHTPISNEVVRKTVLELSEGGDHQWLCAAALLYKLGVYGKERRKHTFSEVGEMFQTDTEGARKLIGKAIRELRRPSRLGKYAKTGIAAL